jgi:heat shock protein HslJ
MLRTMRRILFLVGLAFASGCGDDGAAVKASAIEGVPWALESGPSATFVDGTVTGSTGCNRYTASYTLDGEQLEIGHAATTQMACPPPADGIERDYLAALDRVAAWERSGDELVLSDADGKELLRFRVLSIEGAWEATSFLQRDAVSSPVPGTEVTAEFAVDGTLTGSAGCNTYRATYKAERGAITIDPPTATRKACTEPPGIMEQEHAYLAALPRAAKYSVEGTRLSLLTPQDTYVATYERAP